MKILYVMPRLKAKRRNFVDLLTLSVSILDSARYVLWGWVIVVFLGHS